MINDSIENLLDRLRQRELPPAPDLRREVRADIARRRARHPFWKGLLPVLNWNELLMQPRLAVCAFVVALAVGAIPGVLGVALPSRTQHVTYARASLHLEIFSANVASLPHPTTSPAHDN